mgnify:CR=1 FL=1
MFLAELVSLLYVHTTWWIFAMHDMVWVLWNWSVQTGVAHLARVIFICANHQHLSCQFQQKAFVWHTPVPSIHVFECRISIEKNGESCPCCDCCFSFCVWRTLPTGSLCDIWSVRLAVCVCVCLGHVRLLWQQCLCEYWLCTLQEYQTSWETPASCFWASSSSLCAFSSSFAFSFLTCSYPVCPAVVVAVVDCLGQCSLCCGLSLGFLYLHVHDFAAIFGGSYVFVLSFVHLRRCCLEIHHEQVLRTHVTPSSATNYLSFSFGQTCNEGHAVVSRMLQHSISITNNKFAKRRRTLKQR